MRKTDSHEPGRGHHPAPSEYLSPGTAPPYAICRLKVRMSNMVLQPDHPIVWAAAMASAWQRCLSLRPCYQGQHIL